jgi:hypothetical protein
MAETLCLLRIGGMQGEYTQEPWAGAMQLLSFNSERAAGLNAIHFQLKTSRSSIQILNAVNAETRVPTATLVVIKGGETAVHIEFRDCLFTDDQVYAMSAGHPVETYKLAAVGMNVIEQIGPLSYGTFLQGKTYRY